MSNVDELISKYVDEGSQHRARMQAKLFTLFTETTGHRPEDLCLVEQQIKKGIYEYQNVYFFDWKHRHLTAQPQASLQSQLKECQEQADEWAATAHSWMLSCEKAQTRVKALEVVLTSCKAAMSYAYEDRNDRYYLNVQDTIQAALKDGDL